MNLLNLMAALPQTIPKEEGSGLLKVWLNNVKTLWTKPARFYLGRHSCLQNSLLAATRHRKAAPSSMQKELQGSRYEEVWFLGHYLP